MTEIKPRPPYIHYHTSTQSNEVLLFFCVVYDCVTATMSSPCSVSLTATAFTDTPVFTHLHVLIAVVTSRELFATKCTAVRFLSCVNSHVHFIKPVPVKLLPTDGAGKRFLSRVHSRVDREFSSSLIRVPTEVTDVWSVS